jgi:DNA-binding transcriptional ArsR family regulator
MPAAEIFRALSDPTRRAVFERLAGQEMTVSALSDVFPVSQPAISQHLAVLREAGLVSTRKSGRHAYYRANAQALYPLAAWLDRYRAFWPQRLEKLKNVLKEMEP